MPLDARPHACQLMLHHVRTSRWVMYESLSEPQCTSLSLIGRCVVAWTNLCIILHSLYQGRGMYYNSDIHLPCGNVMNLDCCKMTNITGDFGMAITLDNHYFMLSCQPTPPDALSAPCVRHANSRATCTLLGTCLIQEWASRCPRHELLVDLRCESTYRAASPDHSTNQSRTCPWVLYMACS
jgi:hypothetical protein